MFNLRRNCHTNFQGGCTIFIPSASRRIPVTLHPCQHLVLPVMYVFSILVDTSQYLIMILFCIFLCWAPFHVLVISVSSLVKCCPFKLSIFKNWVDCLQLSVQRTGHKPFVRCVICVYFSHSLWLSFHYCNSVFDWFFSFYEMGFISFSLMDCAFEKITKNSLCNSRSWKLCPVFFLKFYSFICILVCDSLSVSCISYG